MALFVALGVLAIAGLVAALFVVTSGGSTDPDDVLDDAQQAVAGASSFRFDFEDKTTDEAGGIRTAGKGAWTPDRSAATVTEARSVTEVVFEGDSGYQRSATDADAVADRKWIQWEDDRVSGDDTVEELRQIAEDLEGAPDGATDAAAVQLSRELFLGGGEVLSSQLSGGGVLNEVTGDPAELLAAIAGMSDPELVDGTGTTTVASTFTAPDELVDTFGHPIPDGRVELDVGDDDLPTALRFTAAEGASRARLTVGFDDWDDDIDIARPAESDLDETPLVDEEGLRAIEEVTLVAPTAAPAGWDLTLWSPAEIAVQFPQERCEVVGLHWDEPVPGTGYIYLTLRSQDCAEESYPEPFEPGGPGGNPVRTNEYDLMEVLVGDTAVEVETSLDDEQRDAVLASLAPTDVEALIESADPGP